MPTIPLFANASIVMSAGPMHRFTGRATVSFQAGPAHMGFNGSASIVLFTGSRTLPATGRAQLGFETFNLIPAPSQAKLKTAKVNAWMAFPIPPAPAAAALDVRGGVDCDTPYGCLAVGPAGSAPELKLPCFLQGTAAASMDTGSTTPTRALLGLAKPLLSDRPPSCRLSFSTSGVPLDAGPGLAGAAQFSVQAVDRPTRSGDLSGLIVPEIRMEAAPASIRCSTRVCVSDFKVARFVPGDEGLIDYGGPLSPYDPFAST